MSSREDWFRSKFFTEGDMVTSCFRLTLFSLHIWVAITCFGFVVGNSTPILATSNNAERNKIVGSVNRFFKNLQSLRGTFVQTNPDKKWIGGKFYIQRPGKMRFDYKRPSRYRIVADGKWLSIEDPDTNTFNRFLLDSTPFRMLLRKDVNLYRDARVLRYSRKQNVITLTLADRDPMTSGNIKLLFTMSPRLQLRGWTVTDAQGLKTHVRVDNLKSGVKINPSLFKVAPVKFPGSDN